MSCRHPGLLMDYSTIIMVWMKVPPEGPGGKPPVLSAVEPLGCGGPVSGNLGHCRGIVGPCFPAVMWTVSLCSAASPWYGLRAPGPINHELDLLNLWVTLSLSKLFDWWLYYNNTKHVNMTTSSGGRPWWLRPLTNENRKILVFRIVAWRLWCAKLLGIGVMWVMVTGVCFCF